MKTTVIFILAMLSLLSVAAQPDSKREKVNALRPEKTLFPHEFLRIEHDSVLLLLRSLASDFEADKSRQVAALINGKFLFRIQCDGTFPEKPDHKLLQKTHAFEIERIELKFDPAYTPPGLVENFTGFINIIVPKVLSEEDEIQYDPLVARLLVSKEMDKPKPKVFATVKTRLGIYAGLHSDRRTAILGLPLEVPLTERLALQGEFLMNWGQFQDVTLPVTGSDTIAYSGYLSFEARALVKININRYYKQLYGLGGLYVERGKLLDGYSPFKNGLEKRGNYVLGITGGIGLQFKNGLFLRAGFSTRLTNDALRVYNRNFASNFDGNFVVGYRFGGI